MSDKQATKTTTKKEVIDQSIAQNLKIIEMLMGRLSDANQITLDAHIKSIVGLQQRNIKLCEMKESCERMETLRDLGVRVVGDSMIFVSGRAVTYQYEEENDSSPNPDQNEQQQPSEPKEKQQQDEEKLQGCEAQSKDHRQHSKEEAHDDREPKDGLESKIFTLLATLGQYDEEKLLSADEALSTMCRPGKVLPQELHTERCLKVLRDLYKGEIQDFDIVEFLVREIAELC